MPIVIVAKKDPASKKSNIGISFLKSFCIAAH